MPRFSERFSVKGRAEKCKNEGIRVQNMSDLINVSFELIYFAFRGCRQNLWWELCQANRNRSAADWFLKRIFHYRGGLFHPFES